MSVHKSKKPTKDGRCWEYYFDLDQRYPNGRKKQAHGGMFATKKEAQKAEAEDKARRGMVDASKVTMRIVANKYLSDSKGSIRQTTLRNRTILCDKVIELFGDKKITKITRSDVYDFRKKLENSDFKASYVLKLYSVFCALIKITILNYDARNEFVLLYGNLRKKDDSKRNECYNYDEFKRYISVVDDDRYKTFYSIMYLCGLRGGEANALKFSDVDFTKGTIKIQRTIAYKFKENGRYVENPPKTRNSNREIYLPASVLKLIQQRLEHYSKYYGFDYNWYIVNGKEALSEYQIACSRKKYAELAGLRVIRAHDFRHGYASLANQLGLNSKVVSQSMGHNNTKTTLDIYTHVFDQETKDLAQKIEKFIENEEILT